MIKKIFITAGLLLVVLFAEAKEKYKVYPTDSKIIFDFCFFENGEKLAVADNLNIKIFSTKTQKKLDEIKTDLCDRILAVDISKDAKILAFGGRDGIVIIRDLPNKTTSQNISLTGKIITTLNISPDNKLLAIGSSNGKVLIYDIKNKNSRFEFKDHEKDITSIKFSPDGKILATAGGDKKINLYEVENGILITKLSGHKSWVRSISFINNEKLISCGDDSKIIQWDLTDFQNFDLNKTNLAGLGIITGVDSNEGNNSVAASGINGRIMILLPSGTYSSNVKQPVTKVLFIPNENFFLKLVVATHGAGIIQVKAEEMKLKTR